MLVCSFTNEKQKEIGSWHNKNYAEYADLADDATDTDYPTQHKKAGLMTTFLQLSKVDF